MTIYDLIFKAGGFEDLEFRSTMHLERADLIRLDSNKITKSIISFSIFEIMNNPNSKKISNFYLVIIFEFIQKHF